jgi:hypothetical protein
LDGWDLTGDYPNGFTLLAQRRNTIMSMLLHLESSGRATIEYYEENMEIPSYVKSISWN